MTNETADETARAADRATFAAQLRLLAQEVESGRIEAVAIATWSRCNDERCNEMHSGDCWYAARDALLTPLIGAVQVMLYDLSTDATSFGRRPVFTLKPTS